MKQGAELARLRGSRRVYLRHLESSIKDIINLIETFDYENEQNLIELNSLKNSFLTKIQQIKTFDDGYLKLLKPEEFEIELNEIITRDDKNIRIVAKIDHVLNKVKIQQTTPVPNISTLSLANRETLTKIPAKLPKLELTKFDGNIVSWQVFWDQFNSSTHLNNNISDIDKFSYLLSLLEDSVKSLILGLTPSSANYLHAIDLQHERYANPQVLTSAYMQRFVTIPNIKGDKDIRGLRKLYDQVKTSVRNLEL